MSYDIPFVPRRPGQTWESALDEAEGRDVLGDAVRPERLAQWERIVAALRHRLGEVDESVDRDVCEAAHQSGLIVSLYPDEASVTFPYWEREDPQAFHDVVVDVVGVLEGETGLHAWDAQTGEPFDGRVHDRTGLEAARRRMPDVELLQMDARRIPFESEFDVIGAFDVLEHVEEDREVLAEIRRAVRPDGGLVVTVPQHPWLWSASDEFGHHRRRYTRRELLAKVAAAGFEVVLVTSFMTLLLPLMAASRLADRGKGADWDPDSEVRLGARADALLERAMNAEASMLRRGVSLPAGGSLLLAGRAA